MTSPSVLRPVYLVYGDGGRGWRVYGGLYITGAGRCSCRSRRGGVDLWPPREMSDFLRGSLRTELPRGPFGTEMTDPFYLPGRISAEGRGWQGMFENWGIERKALAIYTERIYSDSRFLFTNMVESPYSDFKSAFDFMVKLMKLSKN